MDKFKSIINTYFYHFDSYNDGKITFECDYGELTFYKKNPKIITLFAIYICPSFRQQGLCRDILYYIIDNAPYQFDYFCIKSVLSNILYDYLLRFSYNDTKFVNTIKGFYYPLREK